jgi:hypothetical protein
LNDWLTIKDKKLPDGIPEDFLPPYQFFTKIKKPHAMAKGFPKRY